MKHSAADAVYCAKFIHRLHTLNTWGFSSIQVFDKVRLGPLLAQGLCPLEHVNGALQLCCSSTLHQLAVDLLGISFEVPLAQPSK